MNHPLPPAKPLTPILGGVVRAFLVHVATVGCALPSFYEDATAM